MTLYTVADMHFGHANIIEYCARPFTDVKAMDAALIRNWNATVRETDTVIHCGDFAFRNAAFYATHLHGTIIFIAGNHDDAKIPMVKEIPLFYRGIPLLFTHEPSPVSGLWWNIHGHTHNNNPTAYPFINQYERRCNVSVEMTQYSPVPLDEIFDAIIPRTVSQGETSPHPAPQGTTIPSPLPCPSMASPASPSKNTRPRPIFTPGSTP